MTDDWRTTDRPTDRTVGWSFTVSRLVGSWLILQSPIHFTIKKLYYIETSYFKAIRTLSASYDNLLVNSTNINRDNSTTYQCNELLTVVVSFFCRSSLNLKYFYLAFFIYSCFTVNLTFLVLCLNSWSIDSQRNSTSGFTQVGFFN